MSPKTTDAPLFTAAQIEAAVAPKLMTPLPTAAYAQLSTYLKLLTYWNQKLNLTSVHDPAVLASLHIGECLRAAQMIPDGVETVLDFGSGAGLPGIPIQIARPDLRVTLAESQKKKAAFLREALRELTLDRATVFAARVEGTIPSIESFDLVTLRAVDKMGESLRAAVSRIRLPHASHGGWCMILTTLSQVPAVFENAAVASIHWAEPAAIPGTAQRVILLGSRQE